MMRTNLVLLVALVLSAIYLVGVQYDSRRHFVELDRVNNEARRLAMEHERLQVERRAQATPARVERLAREKLDMRPATAAITTYVNYSAPVGTPPSSGTQAPARVQPGAAAPGGWPPAPGGGVAGATP